MQCVSYFHVCACTHCGVFGCVCSLCVVCVHCVVCLCVHVHFVVCVNIGVFVCVYKLCGVCVCVCVCVCVQVASTLTCSSRPSALVWLTSLRRWRRCTLWPTSCLGTCPRWVQTCRKGRNCMPVLVWREEVHACVGLKGGNACLCWWEGRKCNGTTSSSHACVDGKGENAMGLRLQPCLCWWEGRKCRMDFKCVNIDRRTMWILQMRNNFPHFQAGLHILLGLPLTIEDDLSYRWHHLQR